MLDIVKERTWSAIHSIHHLNDTDLIVINTPDGRFTLDVNLQIMDSSLSSQLQIGSAEGESEICWKGCLLNLKQNKLCLWNQEMGVLMHSLALKHAIQQASFIRIHDHVIMALNRSILVSVFVEWREYSLLDAIQSFALHSAESITLDNQSDHLEKLIRNAVAAQQPVRHLILEYLKQPQLNEDLLSFLIPLGLLQNTNLVKQLIKTQNHKILEMVIDYGMNEVDAVRVISYALVQNKQWITRMTCYNDAAMTLALHALTHDETMQLLNFLTDCQLSEQTVRLMICVVDAKGITCMKELGSLRTSVHQWMNMCNALETFGGVLASFGSPLLKACDSASGSYQIEMVEW